MLWETRLNVGREGSSGLQEPVGRHKPLGKVFTLQVRWQLTKKKAFHLEETVHKGAEKECAVCAGNCNGLSRLSEQRTRRLEGWAGIPSLGS